MAINIPILLIDFVIVPSQPVKTTFSDGNYNDINKFSPQDKTHFKIIGTVIINMIRQAPQSTFYSEHSTSDIHSNPEINLYNCLPKNLLCHKKHGFILLKWIEFNYRGSDNPVIVLQNLKGQTLKQISVSEKGALSKRIAAQNLSSGIYLLTIQGEEVFPVKRVMIEN